MDARLLAITLFISALCVTAGLLLSEDALTGNVVAKTGSHPPNESYLTAFNRPGNYTINVTHVPGVVRGVTPRLSWPKDITFDVIRNPGTVHMDPRTCYNDLVYCYQVIDRQPENRTTFGKNYTGLSSYLLPPVRVRTFVCIGDDAACVRSATNCYCPSETVVPFTMTNERGKCSSDVHLCTNSYSSLVVCTGNLSDCQRRYLTCGCGTQACISEKNTCMNTRNELMLCSGSIVDCLKKYGSCFCGPDMMGFQQGCKTTAHTCMKGNTTAFCSGSLNACAPQFDWCDCD
jgi:hypothetical protein